MRALWRSVSLLEHRGDALRVVSSHAHLEEVWDIAWARGETQQGARGGVLATAYNDPKNGGRAGALYTAPGGERGELERVCGLRGGTRRVCFGEGGALAAVGAEAVAAYDVNAGAERGSWGVAGHSEAFAELGAAAWDPHSGGGSGRVGVAAGRSLFLVDARSGELREGVPRAHSMRCRALAFNPRRENIVATGGDDCRVRVWDLRRASEPVEDFGGGAGAHSHWVWTLAYSPQHEALLASGGSDGAVCLWLCGQGGGALSRAGSLTEPLSPQSAAGTGVNGAVSMGLACAYDAHQDSVYSLGWCAADEFCICSLAYDGTAVVSQVPRAAKFAALQA